MKYLLTTIFLLMMAAASNQVMASVNLSATASPSSTTINHPVAINIAALNGVASQLTVTNVQLTATSTSNPTSARIPMAVSVFNPNNTSITVGAGPAVTTTFNGGTAIFFSPSTGITGSGTGTYTIGGTVFLSDGSVTPITVGAVVTMKPIPLPAYERQ